MPRSPMLCVLAFALGAGGPLDAQAPLSLGQAFRRADSASYANRIAGGDARSSEAKVTAALQGILPTVRVEGGYARTDNPLAAFGFTLQQRGVSSTSFNPGSLNHPTPVTNLSGGLVAEVPILNADAWYGRGAALSAAAAVQAGSGWTRETTRVEVARAYFGAILAREQVHTLEAATAAGQAHVRQSESMVTNGLATRSDALLASVQAGQVEAQLIGARGAAGIARERLALLLGQPGDTTFRLTDSLPPAARIRELAIISAPDSPSLRLDVTAAQLGLEAAQGDVRRASARYLPRVNGFARTDWNSASRLYGGTGSYTVGVLASWTPFAGASEIGDRRAAQGRADAARARAESAEAGAALERSTTRIQLAVAIAQLGIAEISVTQGAEAHRIVARKYSGGLATIAELLSAAALETQTRLVLSEARYQAIVAEAAARQAAGADLMALTALEN
ncbi:MAG: TolC family protein [Gemmatimonadota bacterium]